MAPGRIATELLPGDVVLVLAGISKPVRQVFDVLCIGPLFTVADSVESAQARFG